MLNKKLKDFLVNFSEFLVKSAPQPVKVRLLFFEPDAKTLRIPSSISSHVHKLLVFYPRKIR